MLESTAFKTVLLFLGLGAAVYLCLIRHRGWHADHYGPRAARRHLLGCLVIGILVGCATVYGLYDEIVCPGGYGAPDTKRVQRQHKAGIQIVCYSSDGLARDGSMASGLFAFLGAGVLAFAGASSLWRAFGPPAPPAPPAGTAPLTSLDPPKDRLARRRARKHEQHRNRKS